MTPTVFGKIVDDERARRERAERGEPEDEVPCEAPDEKSALEKRLEELIMSEIAFGPYYWETREPLPWWRKGLHVSLWASEKTLRGAEFVGEVVANIFGLNNSKYQWVVDAMREEKEREEQRKLEEEQRREIERTAKARRATTEAPNAAVDAAC
ncbi:hypothetical protein CTAYLR_003622 [Chrysophaeum taylorii]|uniref:Uncharacterized protein n=1 Tax=Chrysophaeum taylorii TaxID=2483200 RepID=A0AAD7UDD8_9STRA|nr:hypothetical protein CTAYLR_003622 [Chrysophaeum taylorii]